MSGIIGLIGTLIMLGLLMYGIIKKYDTMLLLLVIGTAALVVYSVVTGTSVMGDGSCGNIFLDCFEVIRTSSESMLAGTGLVVMSVMGYVSYMSYIKASDLFAMVLSKPLKKINKPYMIVTATIIVGAFIKLVIPAGSSMTALTLATIYPVLIATGVTIETASSALVLATFVIWGPAESLIYWIFSIVGLEDTSIATYFVQYQIPIVAFMLIAVAITFPITAKFFDNKEKDKLEIKRQDADITPQSLGLPMFYVILPILPLIFVLIFSELILKSVVISIVAANFLSFFIAVIVHMCVKKNVRQTFNESIEFFKGIGNVTGTIVFFFVTGTVFATAMEKIGGMSYLVNLLVSMGGSWITLTVVGCILFTLIIAFTGALEGSIYLFAPLFLKIAEATGGNLLVMITAMIFSAGIGFSICPVSLTNIMVAGETKIPIFRLIKRMTWHVALVLEAIALAYGISWAWSLMVPDFPIPVYGIALITGLIINIILKRFRLIDYVDKRTVTRIGGTATDYLIAFGVASINLNVVMSLWKPILILSLFGILYTFLFLFCVSRKCVEKNWFEKGIFIFGWTAGAMPVAIMLLHITDPDYKSHVLEECSFAWVFLTLADMCIIAVVPTLLLKGYIFITGMVLTAIALLLIVSSYWFYGRQNRKA